MEPTSAASTLSVWIPQAPTDVPALKGSLEMALPAQVGESPAVRSGMTFWNTLHAFFIWRKLVKGGWNPYLCLKTYRLLGIFLLH